MFNFCFGDRRVAWSGLPCRALKGGCIPLLYVYSSIVDSRGI